MGLYSVYGLGLRRFRIYGFRVLGLLGFTALGVLGFRVWGGSRADVPLIFCLSLPDFSIGGLDNY